MDDSRFDNLARSLVIASTRRGFVASLAAGVLGLGRQQDARAAACRAPYQTCREHANCCSGKCGAKDRTGRRHCACPSATVDCGNACLPISDLASDPNNCGACGNVCHPRTPCEAPVCVNGTCQHTPKPNGTPCVNSHLHCNPGTCTDGVCIDGPPLVCPLSPEKCIVVSCDPEVGCLYLPKNCSDGNPCTTDRCNPSTGACVNEPKVCPNGGTCNRQTGV